MSFLPQKISRVFLDGRVEERTAFFLNERRLLIKVNGNPWASIVCSDGNLVDLVAGCLLSFGVIEKKDQIVSIEICPQKIAASVVLSKEVDCFSSLQKQESCCPKNKFLEMDDERIPLKKIAKSGFEEKWIFALAKKFAEDGDLHRKTSGTHRCILARNGEAVFEAEDIGRHTAMDKVLGWMLLNDIPASQASIFTSGRVPLDMVEKVVRAGVGVLITKSVPTSQSVQFAKEYGLKLFFRAWPDSYEKV